MPNIEQHYFTIYEPDEETNYCVGLIEANEYESGIRYPTYSFKDTDVDKVMEEFGFEEVRNGLYEITSSVSRKHVRSVMQSLGFIECL